MIERAQMFLEERGWGNADDKIKKKEEKRGERKGNVLDAVLVISNCG